MGWVVVNGGLQHFSVSPRPFGFLVFLVLGLRVWGLGLTIPGNTRLNKKDNFIIFSYNKTDVAAPFGGFKRSGFGKDLGREALNEYLKTKTITFEYNL